MVCFTLCFSPPSCRDPILQGRGLSCQFPAKEFPARWKDQPGIHVVFFSWQSLQLSAASHPLWKRQEWMKMRKLTKYEQLLTKFFLTWMIDRYIYIYMYTSWRCSHLQPRLLFAPSRPSSSARGVSGWPVQPHLQPSRATWSTSHPKQRWYHSSDDETPQVTQVTCWKKITSIPMRRNTENLQMMGI